MWVMIIVALTTSFGNGSQALSMTHIDHFSSQQACIEASDKILNKDGKDVWFHSFNIYCIQKN